MKTELRIGSWVNLALLDGSVAKDIPLNQAQLIGVFKGEFVVNPIDITTTWLVVNGFSEDNNGIFSYGLQTHYLDITPGQDGFYPAYGQLPEMSSEDEQRVSLNRINFIHEFQNLFFVLTGEEFNIVA